MSYTRLLYFGEGSHVFQLPAYQGDYRDNFASLRTRSDTAPGMDGGLDMFGVLAAPAEVGLITANFTLHSNTRAGMTALRDALAVMTTWGKRPLWMQPADPDEAPRFCRARVRSISMPEKRAQHTDLIQPVTITWEANDPRWLSWPDAVFWDDPGLVWDDFTWVEATVIEEEANNGTIITLTNNGSAPAPVLIRVLTGAETVTNIGVKLEGSQSQALMHWRWNNTLGPGDFLVVDSHAPPTVIASTAAGTDSGYADFERVAGPGFIVLRPGVNTLIVEGTFSDDVTLEFEYYHAWRNT